MKQTITRARFAASSAAAFASIAIIKAPARAAQFAFKYGNDQTISSPVTTRAKEMWAAVERETGGRLHVETFPDSTLGGDTQMVAQVRSGALQFLTEAGSILGGTSQIAQMNSLAYAFKDTKTAFAAVDGEFGDFIRGEVGKIGVHVLAHPWDNGFREITANKPIRNAAELEGLKMRVPASPISLDLFRALGAAPVPINVSELYTALSTHIVEGQENALININQSKLFEVQKTLNFSNHSWDCWWWLVNKDVLGRVSQGHPRHRSAQRDQVRLPPASRFRRAHRRADRQTAAARTDRLPVRRPVVQSQTRRLLQEVARHIRRPALEPAGKIHRQTRLTATWWHAHPSTGLRMT